MKRSFLFLVIIIISFVSVVYLITSCKKDKNTIKIRGLVQDPNTNIYVEGATIVISGSKITNGVYNSSYEEMARTTSDGSGAFSFDLEEERVAGYRLAVTKDGYFSIRNDITTDDMSAGDEYDPVYQLYPIGYIKLKVTNFVSFDSADFIAFTFSSGYLGCYECCDNSMRYGYGEFVDDSLKCKTYGNQNVIVTWNVTKNNMTTLHNATIYCTAFDTVSYHIIY